MKPIFFLPFFLLFTCFAFAQMPIAYYDFEFSSNRSDFNNAVKAEVNSGATGFGFRNCTIEGSDGAGKYNGGLLFGRALAISRGSTSDLDPKETADSYVQFKTNTSGFTGIGITFQVLANNDKAPLYGISISTDNITWTWIASTTTPGTNSLPWLFGWSAGRCNFPTLANSAANLYIRIYTYRTGNNGANSEVRFDNIEITAAATQPNTVKTMLDDRLIFTSKTSGNTPRINSNATITRNNFTVSGSGTAISIPYLDLAGHGAVGGNFTIADNATLTIGSADNALYVDSAKGVTPASAINILSGGTVILNNTLEVQGLLNINNGTLNLNGQKLDLAGALSCTNSSIDARTGTLELSSKRAAQAIAGSFFVNKQIENLINSNKYGVNVSATANDTLKIRGKIAFGAVNNSILNTGDNVTLLSTPAATAAVADLTNNNVNSGNNIIGKVNVERFLSNGAKWRLLAVPTDGTQTFNQAWQESAGANGNPAAGYGILLGNNSSTYLANGFDLYAPGGPTVKTYNPATNGWVGISNTNNLIKTAGAYMTYSRSSRSGVLGATTLRTKGPLYTGTQPIITVGANKFAAVGNPYASEIDLTKLTKTGIQDVFYVWDPKAGGGYGLGAYQSLMKVGADYKVFPGGGSYGAQLSVVNTIESGQAFFVKADSTGGTIQFTETAKVGGSRLVFREINPDNPMLRATLYSVTADTTTLLDGTMVNFQSGFSNAVDGDDILKMTNGSENVSIAKDGVLLLAERTSEPASTETIRLSLTGVRIQSYKWSIQLDGMAKDGRMAFLSDAYTNTLTALDLNGVTSYSFNMVNIPGAYATNRFSIVFAQATVLPVTIRSISASRNSSSSNQVAVNWKVENEINIEQYEVEHSTNGSTFTVFAKQVPAGGVTQAAGYTALHNEATDADNFYRVKATSLGGQVQYSAIVKVGGIKIANVPTISVYPNPVVNKTMNVHFNNQAAGRYNIQLLNQAGTSVYQNTTTIGGNNQVKSMDLHNTTATGNYQLVVTSETGAKTVSQVLVL